MNLEINYPNGHMVVCLDYFLLIASPAKFKKLLRYIERDGENARELTDTLQSHIQARIQIFDVALNNAQRNCTDSTQLAADTQSLIESGRHPNGVRLTENQLELAKVDLKAHRAASKRYLRTMKENQRLLDRFRKFSELMNIENRGEKSYDQKQEGHAGDRVGAEADT